MSPFWGGAAEKALRQFCKRFNLERAPNFHGFLIGRKRVLYRKATSYRIKPQSRGAREHWRLQWKNPLSNPKERGKFTHVLLHALAEHGFPERFYLFPEGQIRRLVKRFPEYAAGIVIAADPNARPNKRSTAKRELLLEHAVSRPR